MTVTAPEGSLVRAGQAAGVTVELRTESRALGRDPGVCPEVICAAAMRPEVGSKGTVAVCSC